MSEMATLKFGIVGGGGIARAHVSAAKASQGRVVIAAVADPSETARASVVEPTGAAGFSSADELLAAHSRQKLIDGLIVCTPPSVRLPIIKLALEREVPVMVEKPIAQSLPDAKAHVELAAKHPGVPSLVGYCHRFVPAVVEMKRQIDSGSLGTILRFENTFACWFPAMRDKWMSDPNLSGGGSFIDTGCHSLDLFQFLLGPATIESSVLRHEWPGRGESSATVVVRGTKHQSVTGVIQSGWLEPDRFTLAVVGTRGLLGYDYEKPVELYFKPSEGKPQVLKVDSHEVRFERQLAAFAAIVRGEKNTQGAATFDDGCRVAELVDSAMKIAKRQ